MRIALIFAIFAPIQLCSFGRNEPNVIRFDTWGGRDTQVPRGRSIDVLSPANNTLVEPGETITLLGFAEFTGAFPEEIIARWLRPDQADPVCSGALSFEESSTCSFTVPMDWQPGAHRMQFYAEAPWGDAQSAFVSLIIEEDQPDPTGPAVLTIGSPPLSSRWSENSPVPFVATLRAGDSPVEDARVVWEVDGLQVSALTARTDSGGTIVRAASFAVGPHEALATVYVNDEPVRASTRFVVTADEDPDTDSDADSDSDSDSSAPTEL